jgi:quercetin dioxygenase-like cupin family protein
MIMKRAVILGAALLAAAALAIAHTRPGDSERAVLWEPEKLRWQDGPASLPPGAKMALLEGDPGQEGFFCMRLRLPDGYRIPPHVHPKTERLTVLSGTFHLGMGEKFDARAARPMRAGSFGYWPAGMKHFVWTRGETVVQLHGVGPWQIVYLNPDDDPRNVR